MRDGESKKPIYFTSHKVDFLENIFVSGILDADDVLVEWRKFVAENKKKDLDEIVVEENLNPEKTREFVENSFRNGMVNDEGTEFGEILPAMSRFGGERKKKRNGVFCRIREFFEKYCGI